MSLGVRLFIAVCLSLFSSLLWAGEYEATLQWNKRVELGPLVSGVVTEVSVVRGDYVSAGQLLLKLDHREYQAVLEKASARVTMLSDERSEAKRELERSQEMFDRTLLSMHDLDLAKLAYSKADAHYREARSARTIAALDLERSRIVSPFDAVVLKISAVPGQSIVTRHQSVSLVTVAASGSMVAEYAVTAKDIDALKQGKKAEVIVNGQQYSGTITYIGLEPDEPGSDRYMVGVVFKHDANTQFRAGQGAQVITP